MFPKADFALLFFFVLYLKKINKGAAVPSAGRPGPRPERVWTGATTRPSNPGPARSRGEPQNPAGLGGFHCSMRTYVFKVQTNVKHGTKRITTVSGMCQKARIRANNASMLSVTALFKILCCNSKTDSEFSSPGPQPRQQDVWT